MTVHAFAEIADDKARNGDVYAATLDANGATLASITLTATYQDSFPNGEDCPPRRQLADLAP